MIRHIDARNFGILYLKESLAIHEPTNKLIDKINKKLFKKITDLSKYFSSINYYILNFLVSYFYLKYLIQF